MRFLLYLQILKLQRQYKAGGNFEIMNFKFKESSCDPHLRLIVPNNHPFIIEIQPEDRVVTHHSWY